MTLGVFSEIGGWGGVQRSGRHAALVLDRLASTRGAGATLLGFADAVGVEHLEVGDRSVHCRGLGRSRLRLLRSVIPLAPRTKLAYLGHPHLAPLGRLLRLLNPSCRYWVAAYGSDVWTPLSPWRRWGLRGAHGILVPSRDTAARLIDRQGAEPAKVHVLPLALDPGFEGGGTDERVRVDLPRGRILLTVARLDEEDRDKGVETVLRALPGLARRVPDVSYVVVGDGNDRGRLEQLATTLGVGERVRFLGGVDDRVVAACYRGSDLFVMPSRQEGFGMTFVEAMAHGRPVVACAHGGATDVVEDGMTGILLPVDRVDELPAVLARLLGSPTLRRQMSERARQRADRLFRFDIYEERLALLLAGSLDFRSDPVAIVRASVEERTSR